jgi:hypothetical protein
MGPAGPAGGLMSLTCTMVSGESPHGDTCSSVATCPAGSVTVGGGCGCSGSNQMQYSKPQMGSDNQTPVGWMGACLDGHANSWVICCTQGTSTTTYPSSTQASYPSTPSTTQAPTEAPTTEAPTEAPTPPPGR